MTKRKLESRIEELERRQPATQTLVSTQLDKDALDLYQMNFHLSGRVYPDYSVFEQTPIAIRGRELVRQICGPVVPAHKDPSWNQRTFASGEFVHCFYRQPVNGDLLRWEHVRVMRGPEINGEEFRAQIEAWHRQLPHLPCPLKFEDYRLFKRQRNGDWVEDIEVTWTEHWRRVECEALKTSGGRDEGIGADPCSVPDPFPIERVPDIRAVMFLGLVDGKLACRPATDEEEWRLEEDEFFRQVLCQEPRTAPGPGCSWARDLRSGFYVGIPIEDLTTATQGPNPVYTPYNFPRKRVVARTRRAPNQLG